MTPTDSPSPASNPYASSRTAPSAEDFSELVRTVRSLRLMVNLSLAVLIVFIALVNAYMLFEVRALRRQGGELFNSLSEMQKTVADYETNSVPVMQRFTADLKRFAERNPDFTPILNRYAGAMAAPVPTNAPPRAPAGKPPGSKP